MRVGREKLNSKVVLPSIRLGGAETGFTAEDLFSLLLPVLALCETYEDKAAEYDQAAQ